MASSVDLPYAVNAALKQLRQAGWLLGLWIAWVRSVDRDEASLQTLKGLAETWLVEQRGDE